MKLKRMRVVYFSPTGGTEKVARFAAGKLAEKLGLEPEYFPFTTPEDRQTEYHFGPDDLLVMVSPVYAGRLPNKLMPEYKAKLFSQSTPAVAICVFGNRSPDDAPRELALLLEGNGFQVAGAAAFCGRHSISNSVGAGRPDEADLAQITDFAAKAADKLAGDSLSPLELDRGELRPYYTPLKEDGTPAKFLKAKPLTDQEKCVRCGLCARSCPMGSIDKETVEATGICIKCQACIRRCPVHAKYFTDPDLLSHIVMLEQHCTGRVENVVLL